MLMLMVFLEPHAQETEGQFYIQLAASRTEVSAADIQRKHGLEQSVIMVHQDEWYKYLLGPFNTYDQAYSAMKNLGIEGFVTRYSDVPVPEKQTLVVEEEEQMVDPTKHLTEEAQVDKPEKPVPPIGVRLRLMPARHEKQIDAACIPQLVLPRSFLHHPGNRGTYIDQRDQNSYGWIRLGQQVWMTDNMRFQMEGATIPAFDSLLPPDYGFLYNAYAASQVCPEGWHLPDDAEWMELERFLGISPSEIRSIGMRESGHVGLALKSPAGWDEAEGGLDFFGFRVLPSGSATLKGDSKDLHQKAWYWTQSRALIGLWARYFDSDFHGIGRGLSSPNKHLSVRCIKN